ncbi:MAG: hypothetical protein LBJ63_09810 [Prevotellaceae bacterium]|nr:hypothetical protein [Prevotellaceae bacterium]
MTIKKRGTPKATRHCEEITEATRHCERSEAIRNAITHRIASGCAFTMTRFTNFITSQTNEIKNNFLIIASAVRQCPCSAGSIQKLRTRH